MSAPGIGAGDIVDGLKFGYKAVGALRENDDGARHHYTQARRALAHRIQALEALVDVDYGPSSAPAIGLLEPLINEDISLQRELSRFEPSLGRGAKQGFHHGPLDKLKFGLDYDKRVREHYDRTRPSVDAAIFQTLKSSMNQINELHSESKQEFQSFINQINQRFDETNIARDLLAHETKLSSKLSSHHAEVTRMLQALILASPASPSGRSPTNENISSRPRTVKPQGPKTRRKNPKSRATPGRSKKRRSHGSSLSNRPPSDTDPLIHNSQTTTLAVSQISCGPPCTSSVSNDLKPQADRILVDARHFISDWLLVLFLVSLTTAYQSPAMRRMISSQLHAAQQDPLLAALLSCIVLALARPFILAPRLISGMSDDNISLQTALGEDLDIPSLYWKSREILHGFLESHFSDRPGQAWVASKNYRILIGGTGGMVIDDAKWSKVVSKKMRLTMAMLLDSMYTCPKCNAELAEDATSEALCPSCKKTFSILHEVSGLDRSNLGDETPHAQRRPVPTLELASKQRPDSSLGDFAQTSMFVNILLMGVSTRPSQKAIQMVSEEGPNGIMSEWDSYIPLPTPSSREKLGTVDQEEYEAETNLNKLQESLNRVEAEIEAKKRDKWLEDPARKVSERKIRNRRFWRQPKGEVVVEQLVPRAPSPSALAKAKADRDYSSSKDSTAVKRSRRGAIVIETANKSRPLSIQMPNGLTVQIGPYQEKAKENGQRNEQKLLDPGSYGDRGW